MPPVKVLFDSQIFQLQRFGGVSRYFVSLAEELSTFPDVDLRVLSPLYINSYLRRAHLKRVGAYIPRVGVAKPVLRSVNALASRPLIQRFSPSIIHETYYSRRPSSNGSCVRVVTVHDMIHEILPQFFSRYDTTVSDKASAISRADHIICVSENTRSDLLRLFDIPEDRVSVIHLGGGCLSIPPDRVHEFADHRPYLLHVGARSGHKNFSALLCAYASSAYLRNNVRIVCFGGGVLSRKERSLIADLGILQRNVVHCTGDDEFLAACYAGAEALVYPSLYEGFGIPPLEAMALGCPVVCSTGGAIPEIVGDAGVYFDPVESDSLSLAVVRLLQSEEQRKLLVERGKRRCSLFSWRSCAQNTVALYRRLLMTRGC